MRGSMALPLLPSFALLSYLISTFAPSLSLAFNLSSLPFDSGYVPLFGGGNLVRSPDGNSVRLLLDRFTGSGFISSEMYHHGFFSASIKLPSNYTAGVVVAFYASNGDVFEKRHDELDFEFLGNVDGKSWRVQTNVYGNGSTSRGREERYNVWFDPTKEFHRYSILWTRNTIIFYIDEVPIREVVRSEAMGGDYPSKPMPLYTTIWDGSTWATSGGRYKVDYRYAPFTAQFTNLVLRGCSVDHVTQRLSDSCPEEEANVSGTDYTYITPAQRDSMRKFRLKYMTYSYCYDAVRYPVALPECVVTRAEKLRFKDTGHMKLEGHRRHRRKRRSRIPVAASNKGEQSTM